MQIAVMQVLIIRHLLFGFILMNVDDKFTDISNFSYVKSRTLTF